MNKQNPTVNRVRRFMGLAVLTGYVIKSRQGWNSVVHHDEEELPDPDRDP